MVASDIAFYYSGGLCKGFSLSGKQARTRRRAFIGSGRAWLSAAWSCGFGRVGGMGNANVRVLPVVVLRGTGKREFA